jgi:hypothetical protein
MTSAPIRTATARVEIAVHFGAQLRVIMARAVPSTRVVCCVELRSSAQLLL